ncbi:MAG TPA: hypothetical protein VHE61_18275 [Opitutaceae bacterium]|nr:hypothetical protein [Opitutaceae bacterium]
MNPKRMFCGIALSVGILAGCQKQPPPETPKPEPPKPVTVEVVKPAERSPSFLAVNRHLELGGTLYGYVDVDGDVLKAVGGLQDFLKQLATTQPMVAPFAAKDYKAVAATLGLTDIKAMGLSSVPDGTGFFRNRVFIYTPGDRHGLLLGLGGKPGPFTHLNLAPADTAFYAEADLDLPVVYETIKQAVTQIAGEPVGNQMEAALKKAGEKAALSVFDLIYGLKGHSAIVMRVDPEQTFSVGGPSGLTLPKFSLLVCMDRVAPAVEPALQKSPLFKRSDVGTEHVYTFAQPLPVPGLQPVVVADGTTLYFATTQAFLDECRALKTGLAQSPEYQQAVAGIGTEGNGISYVSPRLLDAFRRIQTLNPNLPAQQKAVLGTVLAKVPDIKRPMVAIRTNLPDGILVRSYWDRSLKQEVALAAAYNPVTVGVLAAMAIPAFQKVRQASQEKAVLNNLRQLSAAADQYYLEHGVTTVTYDELVGPGPGKYIRRIVPVAGENYRAIQFSQGKPLRVRLSTGRVIQYPQAMPRRGPAQAPKQ